MSIICSVINKYCPLKINTSNLPLVLYILKKNCREHSHMSILLGVRRIEKQKRVYIFMFSDQHKYILYTRYTQQAIHSHIHTEK
jgi:hypothetical protein